MAFAALTDRHVAGDSFLHRMDARAKLVMALGFIFSAISTPVARWDIFAALGVLIVIAIAFSGLSPTLILRRSLLALPFTLAAVPMLFRHAGAELFTVPVFGWTATDTGLEFFASILLRSWLSVLCATILTATTESDRLLRGLRSFGVPKLLVGTISFMWRYVFVIAEEAQRLMVGRAARSARVAKGHGGGSLAWRGKVAGNMVGSLFLRSLNRSERVYVAMLSRGYNGEMRSLERFTLTQRDIVVAAATVAVAALIQVYARF
jgi:cobalt/nickel transport system permease protein